MNPVLPTPDESHCAVCGLRQLDWWPRINGEIICPDCRLRLYPNKPVSRRSYAGKVVWGFVIISTTIAVGWHDGWTWTTALWMLEMGALGFVRLPAWKELIEKGKGRSFGNG